MFGSWIIDARATNHICGSLSWFDSYEKINHISDRLPTGHLAIAKHVVYMKFSSDSYS